MNSLNVSNSFAELSPEFYTRLQMQGLRHEVKLLHVNPEVAELLDISPAMWASPEFLEIMSGHYQRSTVVINLGFGQGN